MCLMLKSMILVIVIFLLHGYRDSILYPVGKILYAQHKLIFISFFIMLIVVIPVIFMTFFFSYKYNAKNVQHEYCPNWSHSNKIETIIWVIPIMIIVFLGVIAWQSSHTLDPKKPITSVNRAIVIDVVSLDWKWLFIYPNNTITINEIILPINTPIIFHITSYSVMSSFFIPVLGSQIYSMPGMKTTLYLIANIPGTYYGLSANYNGLGFSNMKFNVFIVPNNNIFYLWMNKLQNSIDKLNNVKQFMILSNPHEFCTVKYFSIVFNGLFDRIINRTI
ncbi:ubiquinol oxidase subunit II [Buchnera aphidicola]|uniref:Ubiquinol oxidase subunit 2 n=1 Tax=Buchnera aphidicola (Stegophylla sp.) TaxID=2315800 RepID=A0A4D6YLD3_9GAMM|nr:ubiquinol oxidase subunit II [Buchnera aphidicola (Stegophylla sp.)]QCI26448.1 ubiquinol oxidase subunit II [Buchnera aphidicola (Stegophylla sp.)]